MPHILDKPYHQVVMPDEEGLWLAQVLEFPGCMATGLSRDDALAELRDAAESWVEACEENNIVIPLPLETIWPKFAKAQKKD